MAIFRWRQLAWTKIPGTTYINTIKYIRQPDYKRFNGLAMSCGAVQSYNNNSCYLRTMTSCSLLITCNETWLFGSPGYLMNISTADKEREWHSGTQLPSVYTYNCKTFWVWVSDTSLSKSALGRCSRSFTKSPGAWKRKAWDGRRAGIIHKNAAAKHVQLLQTSINNHQHP